jgi:hypothetical protein
MIFEKLKFPIVKNEFRYDLIKRIKDYAVVSQTNLRVDAPVRYELWRIRKQKETHWGDIKYKAKENPPTDKQWGVDGWTYFHLEDALTDLRAKA